jgi:hypothetical protein
MWNKYILLQLKNVGFDKCLTIYALQNMREIRDQDLFRSCDLHSRADAMPALLCRQRETCILLGADDHVDPPIRVGEIL